MNQAQESIVSNTILWIVVVILIILAIIVIFLIMYINYTKKQIREDLNKQQNTNETNLTYTNSRYLNSKIIGEELEQWLYRQYQMINSNFDGKASDYRFELKKDNKSILNADETKGTKADFLYEITNNITGEVVETIIIEAKTENSIKQGNQKNKNFIEKLELDRRKKGARFAILVTELEPSEDFLVRSVSDNENIFMCRPYFFTAFLNILKSLVLQEINLKQQLMSIERIDFQKANEILNNFNIWRNEKILKEAENIKKKLDRTLSHSQKIQDIARKLEQEAEQIAKNTREILTLHANRLINNINDYHIAEKVINEIEQLGK